MGDICTLFGHSFVRLKSTPSKNVHQKLPINVSNMWRVFVGDLNVGYHAASVQMPLLAKYTNDWQVLTGMLAGGLECTKGIGVIDLYRERNFRSGTEPVMRTQLC